PTPDRRYDLPQSEAPATRPGLFCAYSGPPWCVRQRPAVAETAVMSDTLTVQEAATVAGVSVRTMRRWAANGQVRTIGQGHGRRIVAASLSKEAAIADANGQSAVGASDRTS